MQKLVPLLARMAGSMGELKVDRLTVLGKGGPSNGGGSDLAAKLVEYSEQIRAATGIDVSAMVKQKLGPS
jgi:flotillin